MTPGSEESGGSTPAPRGIRRSGRASHEARRGHEEGTGLARRLHDSALVVDLHADTPSARMVHPRYDFGRRHDHGHLDLPRLREAGVNVQILVAWVPAEYADHPGASFRRAQHLIDAIHRTVERTPGVRLASTPEEVDAAVAAGDVAALIGVEGGHAIDSSLDRLRELYRRGARYMTLTWNNTNEWADACCSPPRHGGLSAFGRSVVQEMNRLGMLVDVSHAAQSTFYAVLETTTAPIIASHSNARALSDHPRNLDDAQLRALARNGGVVGINFYAVFLDARLAAAVDRIEERGGALERRLRRRHHPLRARKLARDWTLRRLQRLPRVPIDVVADHIAHVADVAGPDHVALGSDFDGIHLTPIGLDDVTGLPRLTELLVRRGFSEAEIRGILGANFMRVFRAASSRSSA